VGTEGDLGLAVRVSFGEEEGEREVSGDGLELRVIYKACWRARIGRDALIKRET
jgi:hypothetical protein